MSLMKDQLCEDLLFSFDFSLNGLLKMQLNFRWFQTPKCSCDCNGWMPFWSHENWINVLWIEYRTASIKDPITSLGKFSMYSIIRIVVPWVKKHQSNCGFNHFCRYNLMIWHIYVTRVGNHLLYRPTDKNKHSGSRHLGNSGIARHICYQIVHLVLKIAVRIEKHEFPDVQV